MLRQRGVVYPHDFRMVFEEFDHFQSILHVAFDAQGEGFQTLQQ